MMFQVRRLACLGMQEVEEEPLFSECCGKNFLNRSKLPSLEVEPEQAVRFVDSSRISFEERTSLDPWSRVSERLFQTQDLLYAYTRVRKPPFRILVRWELLREQRSSSSLQARSRLFSKN